MRFFQRCRTFWQQKGGFGMIEAAITLPLFLMITFGVMEFGNMYLQRYAVRDVSDAVKDYLQAKPNATLDDLTQFVNALGVGLKGTGEGEENRIITKIRIASNKTIYTTAQFNALCASSAAPTFPIPNPWANDPVPGNRNNQYFIHICYPYTYKAITPLPGLTADVIPETKVLNGKAVAIINAGNTPPTTCVAGQVTWNGNYNGCHASHGQLTEGNSQNLTYLQYENGCNATPPWNGYYQGSLTVTCTNGAIVQSNASCNWVETGCGGNPSPPPPPPPVTAYDDFTSPKCQTGYSDYITSAYQTHRNRCADVTGDSYFRSWVVSCVTEYAGITSGNGGTKTYCTGLNACSTTLNSGNYLVGKSYSFVENTCKDSAVTWIRWGRTGYGGNTSSDENRVIKDLCASKPDYYYVKNTTTCRHKSKCPNFSNTTGLCAP